MTLGGGIVRFAFAVVFGVPATLVGFGCAKLLERSIRLRYSEQEEQ